MTTRRQTLPPSRPPGRERDGRWKCPRVGLCLRCTGAVCAPIRSRHGSETLLFAIPENFRNHVSQHTSFMQRGFFDSAREPDPLHHDDVPLKFAFIRQNQVIAVVYLGKADFLGLDIYLWTADARH